MEVIILEGKRLKKVPFYSGISVVIVAAIILGVIFVTKKTPTSESVSPVKEVELKKPKLSASVHDPSIVSVDNTYYVFGSHIDAAKSTDLKTWTKFTNGYTTPKNVVYGNLSENLAGSFAWAGQNDSDSRGGYSVWAPFAFWNKDYVNADGSTGAYMMYYCTSSTYIRSALGYAVSKNIEGPYTYVDTLLYSGFTKSDSYDKNSKINTNYVNTNIPKLISSGLISEVNSRWFTGGKGAYNNITFPNAIDPALFYDKSGKLWMMYGSWSGGIFALEIDKTTGKAIYPGKDGKTADGRIIDRYFGTKISGGYGKSGEGPFVVYDKSTDYYYLYVTYGGLAANGGYNMRLFRSKNPDGPYLDAKGKNAVLMSNTDNAPFGVKIMGNYKLSSLNVGYKSPGHNSSFIDADGQMYLIYHTRFNNGTEGHQIRVHQMFINEDGWPVTAPYEYNGDTISQTGYSVDEVVGTYEFINHGTGNTSSMLQTLTVNLNKDNTISGDVTGKWSMTSGKYYMSMDIKGVTYKGVFFKQNDESKFKTQVMTFSAIGTNNQSLWGSKAYSDSDAINFAAYDLEAKFPKNASSKITLPTEGNYGTTITWTSDNEKVITAAGEVKKPDSDTEVTLTAKITKDSTSAVKALKVKVQK